MKDTPLPGSSRRFYLVCAFVGFTFVTVPVLDFIVVFTVYLCAQI